ncbi:MAG TPA: helix-turn-helix domain-containing protein [Longimicrobiaceae bacterium]|nr:helix-turn-helix domain-containing protein [Longimicrobiaceae bacterium]
MAEAAAVYREHAPSPALADLVECYWTIHAHLPAGETRPNRVLPDGCMDVIFDLGDPPLRGGCSLRSYAVGAMRQPLLTHLAGRVELVGVRFRPGGAPRLLGVAAHELADRTAPLHDLWHQPGRDLEEAVAGAPAAERMRVLDAALLRRLGGGYRRDPAVACAAALIARSGGRLPVRALHEPLGITRRHLERIFAEAVGLTPKLACRVARFHAALRLMDGAPGLGWSRLALEAGFYDQAHLIREFRDLSGLTPVALRAERGQVASVQDGGAAAA